MPDPTTEQPKTRTSALTGVALSGLIGASELSKKTEEDTRDLPPADTRFVHENTPSLVIPTPDHITIPGDSSEDLKPVVLSEAGNPVGEANPQPATTEPAVTHEPISTGDNTNEAPEGGPQIISSPKLPDVQTPAPQPYSKEFPFLSSPIRGSTITDIEMYEKTGNKKISMVTQDGYSHSLEIDETKKQHVSIPTSQGPDVKFTTEAPISHSPMPVEVPGITFTDTSAPPPEATIAAEVPPQNTAPEAPPPARTGIINKLKGLIGR